MISAILAIIWGIRTVLSAGVAALVVSSYLVFMLLIPGLLTLYAGLSLSAKFGYDQSKLQKHQYEFQDRFKLEDLPEISNQEYDRLFRMMHSNPDFIIKNHGTPNLCITRMWSNYNEICIIHTEQRNYVYTFPQLIIFPCVNPLEILFGCQRSSYPYFDKDAGHPSEASAGWYYSPEYGVEQIVFDPKARANR